MLLVYEFNEIEGDTADIEFSGYGFSVLGPYVDDAVDHESVVDALKDWGWAGSTMAPEWLI